MSAKERTARGGLALLVLVLLAAFPSFAFIHERLGFAGIAGYLVVVASCLAVWIGMPAGLAAWIERHHLALGLGLLALLAVAFVVLHPIEEARGKLHSSDRDEALDLAVGRMLAGQTPYYPPTDVAGPLSLLPGALLLAAPFVFVTGTCVGQNLFWLGAWWWWGGRRWAGCRASLGMLLLLLVSPAFLYEYVSGGDLIANGIYVPLLMLVALADASRDRPWLGGAPTAVLVGVALASRMNVPLLVPVYAATLWRLAGFRRAAVSVAVSGVVAAALTLPFYFHDPEGFTPLLTRHKLAALDAVVPWASSAVTVGTVLLSLAGGLRVLLAKSGDPLRSFFRVAAMVVAFPMIAVVVLGSVAQGRPDFSSIHDRFGLMYLFFALWGWWPGARRSGTSRGGTAVAEVDAEVDGEEDPAAPARFIGVELKRDRGPAG